MSSLSLLLGKLQTAQAFSRQVFLQKAFQSLTFFVRTPSEMSEGAPTTPLECKITNISF